MKKIPKYKEIENDILTQIHSGKLKAGDQIMTENELCEYYAVSRMTARKALESLNAKGILTRIAGKGSFVNKNNIRKPRGLTRSFSKDILSIGKQPGSILCEYKLCPAYKLDYIAYYLNIPQDELVHYICRIRTADDVRIALSYTYIPTSILPALDIHMLDGSIYEYIEKTYEISHKSNETTIEAITPNDEQIKMLNINANTALLKVSHPSLLTDGRVFEYTVTYYVGDRFIYTWCNYDDEYGSGYRITPRD